MGQLLIPFSGGAPANQSYGQQERVIFANTWNVGDTWMLRFITTSGNFTIGRAVEADGVTPILAGTKPTYGLTLSERVFLANGTQFNFSDNNNPTEWYEQGPGAGFVQVLTNYGGQDAIYSLASYQGYLAAFLRNSIQIWIINADPAQFALKQALPNIGTRFGFSVQSLGDWDVLFLADSGVRSLRVRDSSLNAVTTDIGSPIDAILTSALAAGGYGTPISVVEPTNNRYWLYLGGTIYVLSFYQTENIKAWSTYKPTVVQPVAGTQTPFVPSKFVVLNGVVYCRANATIDGVNADWLVAYSTTIDNAVATVVSPYLDAKMPDEDKIAEFVNVAITGSWQLQMSFDFTSGTFELVDSLQGATYDGGDIAIQMDGTHFAFKLVTTDSNPAIVSAVDIGYET